MENLELQIAELVAQIEHSKIHARGLLAQRELKERKIKLIVGKLEGHLKGPLGMR